MELWNNSGMGKTDMQKWKENRFVGNDKEYGMIRWMLVDIRKSSNVGECLFDQSFAGLEFVWSALLYDLCLLCVEDLKLFQLFFLTLCLFKTLFDKLALCLSSSFFSQFLDLFRRKVVVFRSTVTHQGILLRLGKLTLIIVFFQLISNQIFDRLPISFSQLELWRLNWLLALWPQIWMTLIFQLELWRLNWFLTLWSWSWMTSILMPYWFIEVLNSILMLSLYQPFQLFVSLLLNGLDKSVIDEFIDPILRNSILGVTTLILFRWIVDILYGDLLLFVFSSLHSLDID